MAIGNKILGGRIRKFRQRLKLKQRDLASQIGLKSSQIISQIEKGEREVKAWELAELSRILAVSVNDLLVYESPEKAPIVLWRQSPENQKEFKESLFIKRCQQYTTLEKLSGSKRGWSFPQKDVNLDSLNFDAVDQLAIEVRRELNLGNRPAEELENTLQNVYGVKIWYMDMGEGSAASTIGPFGPAILMNSNEAPWRRNFNFAHELFHLITWRSIPPASVVKDAKRWNWLEKLANAFASSLLLPEESLSIEFKNHLKNNKLSYYDLIEIARCFGVSTEALIYRLKNLKKISDSTVKKILKDPLFREIDRSTMAPHWWQPPDIPERFVRLAFVAFQKGTLSRSKLSEMLDTSLIDLSDTLSEYGLSDHDGYDVEVRTA